ncbi:rhodanese-like domain-containing protein [Pelomonas sp. SE-A7]|uniref:rhodanese-like domain-containing protein n=1 Tax=Pelomonas sp. SE-A7 TaxID=3054953 RepID=UPI00259CEE15|nr:rhodanese-like domain-containing protein [Pelomonas sp. SE-A7]MDM4764797.1 rhodanese-like domain-containing protein [Pelomonas sp. SE-A7]
MSGVQVSAPDLQRMLQGAAGPVPLLLDVREVWEREHCRIEAPQGPGLHIPMGQVPARLAELDPLHPVVVYCHHGVRSLQVVAFLRQQGLDSVYNLAGGIDAWSLAVDSAVPRY